MTFKEAIQQGIEIVKLNRPALREVAGKPEAFSHGLIITAIMGIAAWLEPTSHRPWEIISGPLVALFWLFAAAAILHFVAMLLGGKGEYMNLLRAMGLARVLGWIVVVPWLGKLVFVVWTAVIAVVAMEELYGLDRVKAILCVAIPWAVLGLLSLIIGALFLSLAAVAFLFGL